MKLEKYQVLVEVHFHRKNQLATLYLRVNKIHPFINSGMNLPYPCFWCQSCLTVSIIFLCNFLFLYYSLIPSVAAAHRETY